MELRVKFPSSFWITSLLSVAALAAPTGDLRLVDAAEKGEQETVRSLLKEHPDVNVRQADGATALQWAAHWDDIETAELLIAAGADVDAANEYGVTALSLACINRNDALVEKLLNAGAHPNAALWTGETPLMTCARTGNANAVRMLVARGADVNAKETQNGQTALMWAVAQGHRDVVRWLTEYGAHVHARSDGGFTPLLFAARHGDVDSARVLLAAGANIHETTSIRWLRGSRDSEGMNPLLVAIESGHEAFAIFLLENGAAPNSADGDGITALHYALKKPISFLTGNTYSIEEAYHFRPNMAELVKALVTRGADPNARVEKEPPWYAAGVVRRSRNKLGVIGATPLLLAAAAGGDPEVMRILAANGADPSLKMEENTTALMLAAGMGRLNEDRDEGIIPLPPKDTKSMLEAMQVALDLGADINAVNDDGRTALQAASEITGGEALVQFLLERGAKAVSSRRQRKPEPSAEE